MTIQTVSPFFKPRTIRDIQIGGTGLNNVSQACGTLNAVNQAMGIIFVCPVAGTLTDFAVRTQTVTTTAGNKNFDFRVETVSAGLPSGTLFGTNSNVTVVVANGDNNIWKTATLTTGPTVAKGNKMALVIKAPAAGTFSFTWGGFSTWTAPTMFPVGKVDTAAAGTYTTLMTSNPSFAVKISGTWYAIDPFLPIDSITNAAFSSASNPNEYAIRIVPEIGIRVAGMGAFLSNVATNADFTCSLWPDSGSSQTDANALAQIAFTGNVAGNTTNDGTGLFLFPSSVTLTVGTPYWLGVRADGAGTLIVFQTAAWSTAGMGAMPGGANFYTGTRQWSGGSAPAFTTATGQQPLISAYIDGLDLAAGGVSRGRIVNAGAI